MTDAFIGEIRLFPYGFAPKGWLDCDGSLLKISDNTTLFSIIGTFYGGDGRLNFALPNLSGAVPVGQGNGPGLPPAPIGQSSGSERVTLTEPQMPAHTHSLNANIGRFTPATFSAAPTAGVSRIERYIDAAATPPVSIVAYNAAAQPVTPVQMAPNAIGAGGASGAHENRQPFLTFRYCIATQGTYPNRPS